MARDKKPVALRLFERLLWAAALTSVAFIIYQQYIHK
jgi:hypothetical protein